MDNTMMGVSSMYTSDYWKSAASTKDLEKSLTSNMQEKTKEELMEVCKDFEAYFVEQMFKAMEKMVPKNEESENAYTDMFGDMLIQEYAKSASEQQQMGIAQMLYEQMKRNYGLE